MLASFGASSNHDIPKETGRKNSHRFVCDEYLGTAPTRTQVPASQGLQLNFRGLRQVWFVFLTTLAVTSNALLHYGVSCVLAPVIALVRGNYSCLRNFPSIVCAHLPVSSSRHRRTPSKLIEIFFRLHTRRRQRKTFATVTRIKGLALPPHSGDLQP